MNLRPAAFKVTKHTKKVVWKVKDFPKLKKVPLEPLKAIKSAQEEDAISGGGVPWLEKSCFKGLLSLALAFFDLSLVFLSPPAMILFLHLNDGQWYLLLLWYHLLYVIPCDVSFIQSDFSASLQGDGLVSFSLKRIPSRMILH